MGVTWTSVLATRPWRTCSRSRVFRGSIFVDEAASTKWSGPPFAFGVALWAFRPSYGYKAGDRAAYRGQQFWEMAR